MEVLDSNEIKIGVLVRSTFKLLVKSNLISNDMVRFLTDANYCKNTFNINYPVLKKVDSTTSVSEQRKINGYDRYWAEVFNINGENYFVCNDWYEDRNRSKFKRWIENLKL